MDNPPPINWLALLSRGPFFPSTPSYPDPFLEPAPAPNGWLDLPQLPTAMATALKYAHARGPVANALLTYPPQPPFADPLDAAAWARTAGHIDAPSCRDEEGVPLLRNVRGPGEFGAWDKARILDGAFIRWPLHAG
jgi:hypothetical protein